MKEKLLKGFFLVIFSIFFLNLNNSRQALATSETVPNEMLVVANGTYDVIVLSANVSKSVRNSIKDVLYQNYGEEMLEWSVKEKHGVNFVFAYPFEEDLSENAISAETLSTRQTINSILESSTVYCNRLYDGYFFIGQTFSICLHGITLVWDLSPYGFNNKASSYYHDHSYCGVELFDQPNGLVYLASYGSPQVLFPSGVNNKTTSLTASCP